MGDANGHGESHPFGRQMTRHFMLDPEWVNLNHGSFGTAARCAVAAQRCLADKIETRPDYYIRYKQKDYSDASRAAVAELLHAHIDTCVFVPNATTAINTVFRNIEYMPGDKIVYFGTVYPGCQKIIEYICETTPAESICINYTHPVSDQFLIDAFQETIVHERAAGNRVKIALFDTISSLPGTRMPFEELTAICKREGVYSHIDGAHGVGHMKLNLTELDPDFFVSNCHKWLYTPRGSAVFYVPVRNQHLIRSTMPTSHGFVPKPKPGEPPIRNPLPTLYESHFLNNFDFTGTTDKTPFLALPKAVEFRSKLQWNGHKGEAAIMNYCHQLANEGGEYVAKVLGTRVMSNAGLDGQVEDTLGREVCMTTVQLPLVMSDIPGGDVSSDEQALLGPRICHWMERVMVSEFHTFMATIFYGGVFWVRLSAQIYLEMADFEFAADVLQKLCTRVQAGEYRGS